MKTGDKNIDVIKVSVRQAFSLPDDTDSHDVVLYNNVEHAATILGCVSLWEARLLADAIIKHTIGATLGT